MISKNSFFKGASLLRESCRRHVWITILSCIGFLLSIVLPIMVVGQRYRQFAESGYNPYSFENASVDILQLLSFFNPVSSTILIALAILGGIGLFCYLHSGKETDFFHSLPISRNHLFWINYAVAPAIVIPCYGIILLLGVIVAGLTGFGGILNAGLILFGFVQSSIFFLLIYSVAVLGAILCGNKVIAALLLLWMYFSPTAWIYTLVGYMSTLKTYITPDWLDTLAMKLSPIIFFYAQQAQESEIMYEARNAGTMMTDLSWMTQIATGFWLELLECVIAFGIISLLCYFLFRIRPSESAGSALAFEKSQTPIQIYMVVFIALVGGLFLSAIMETSYLWMAIGILIGGIIMHMVVEAIYAFDVRAIFHHLPHLGISILLALVLAFGIRMDVFGYDTKRVDLAKIESADFYCYNLNSTTVFRGHRGAEEAGIFQDQANIEKVWQVANDCVDSLEKGEDENEDTDASSYLDCVITFHMKSGSTMQRNYYVYNADARGLAEELTLTPEYLQTYHELYRDDFMERLGNEENQRISLRVKSYYSTSNDEELQLSDRQQIKEIWEAAREDLSRTDLDYFKTHLPELYIQSDHGGARIPIYPSYHQTLSLIQKYTKYQPFDLQADDVAKIKIRYYMYDNGEPEMYYEVTGIDDAMDATVTVERTSQVTQEGSREAEVTDPKDIQGLLLNMVPEEAIWSREYADETGSAGEVDLEVWMKDGTKVYSLGYLEGQQPTELLGKYFAESQAVTD